jgi:Spy/CpxP family protein refolding chaperone
MKKLAMVVFLLASVAALPALTARAQTGGQDGKLDRYMELARTDLRTKKAAIINEQLPLTKEQGEAFWPVYKRYEAELVALNDLKLALIKDYAASYNSNSMTDAKARELTDKALDLEGRKDALRRKYIKEFQKVLPAKTAAQFYQLDRRIDLLMDLQIAAEIPIIN